MDGLRPEKVAAHTLADRAVREDEEARARIKAEKKAAAEERKREHARRVAHNKQTDIVYLGRGVSAGLADRRSNVEALQLRGLPLLSTPADAAAALGVAVPRLRWLAFHAEASTVCHYVHFPVPKKSGGERDAQRAAPAVGRRPAVGAGERLGEAAGGRGGARVRGGRGIRSNAQPHVGSAVVVNCDLTDFFPSVHVHRVMGLFRQVGYSPAVATVLALLVTECPRRKVLFNGRPWYVATGPRGLPQGACTSPAISNLVARRLDARFSGLARRLGWAYTRYADDLTFSSKEPSDRVGYLLARVRHIAGDEGFTVNEKKTRVLRPAARQSVTGVVTNEQPAAPRQLRRRLRAILHNATRTGLAAQNRNGDPQFDARLRGSIAYVQMLNPHHAEPLREQLARAVGR